MKKILLNWLPPAQLNSPSPSFSVLKGYLEQGGYMVDIRYWNIDLDAYLKDFFVYGGETYEHQRGNSSIQQLLPLLAYLAIQNKDESLIGKIRNYVLSLKPQLNDKTNNFFNNYLKKFYDNLNFIIDKTLSNIILTNYLYLGFSSQYYQWIAANIIIERIKLISPNSVVVIGGCGSKQEAYALANNFKHFNFISWGEGEFLLLELTRYLDTTYHSEVNLTDIPNIVFRNGDQLVVSQISNVFVDINQSTYDYSDYFSQIKHSSIAQKIKVKLPFEKSRGCHWRKCHFCSLNTGYKFRSKSSEKAIDEIKDSITKYNTNEYFFVDNDVVANDIPGFEDFLDMLIEFRTTLHNDFKISMAEIITDGINSTIIKKMSLAGFEKIQIGYESP
ncbi:MAG: hypothetical protein FWC41_13100, partial [Firmicutes bacterium]|nr:hypothetical protein [Bacillota bacterium]